MNIYEIIEDMGFEDVVVLSNPDYSSALIGVTDCSRAVYDFDKMVEYLMREEGMTDLEAIEWIECNTIRALPYAGEAAPLIMYRLPESEEGETDK